MSTKVHGLVEEGDNIGVEGLPVWVLEMVFLTL
jgi:hypothetical protein